MAQRTPSPVRSAREGRAASIDPKRRELAHVRLEFAVGHLDRVEIGRILRQVAQRCAGCRNRLGNAGHLMGAQVIHHDDIGEERLKCTQVPPAVWWKETCWR
jgi:hypothetical protein